MKKIWLPILAFFAFLLVLIGIYTLLTMLVPSEDPATSPSGEESQLLLLHSDPAQIARIDVQNEQGSYAFIPDPNKTSGFAIEGMEVFAMYEGFVESAMKTAYDLTAARDLGVPENTADYGLADPSQSLIISYTDGSAETLLVGSAVPGQESLCYVKLSTDPHVYTAALDERLRGTPLGYLDLTLVNVPAEAGEEVDDGRRLTSVRIEGTNWASPVTIKENPQFEKPAAPFSACEAVMEAPIRAGCADEGWTLLKTQLFDLTADRAVAAPVTQDDLRSYGLDAPAATVSFKANGVSYTLAAGKKADGGYFVRRLDTPAVASPIFEVTESAVSAWTDGDFYSKTASLARPFALEDIEGVSVTFDGKTTEFSYTPPRKNSDGEVIPGQEGKAYAKDKTLTLTNFEIFFGVIASVRSEGMPGTPVSGSPELTVKVRFRKALSAPDAVVRFYPAGERRYNVVYGDEDCYVTVRGDYVRKLKEDTEKCAADLEVLPMP